MLMEPAEPVLPTSRVGWLHPSHQPCWQHFCSIFSCQLVPKTQQTPYSYSYVIWVAGAWGLRIAYAIKALAIRCLHCGLMATYIAWWKGFLERAHVSSKIADVSNHRLCHIRKVLTKILQAYHQQRRPPAIFSPTQISEAPLGWKYMEVSQIEGTQ